MTEQTNTTPLPSDDITPEELADASRIRSLENVPSNWTVKGEPTSSFFTPSVEALNPEDRKTVYDRAGAGADEAKVQATLMDFLRAKQGQARIIAGAGEGATEVEQEALSQMKQVMDLSREFDRVNAELNEISRYDQGHDADGNPIAVPVLRLEGEARNRRQYRLAEIAQTIDRIEGEEGKKALEEAAKREALQRRALRTQVEDAAEVKRRAELMVREERINARAATRARMIGNTAQ
jgi:hypothetical protein